MTCSRSRGARDSPWKFVKGVPSDAVVPVSVRIVPEEYLPPRNAKTRTHFREHLLRQVHKCHKVLGNLVLSQVRNMLTSPHCVSPRPPAIKVADHDEDVSERRGGVAHFPGSERTRQAAFYTGNCQRRVEHFIKTEKYAALKGIATIGSQNMMDLLSGLPNVDSPLTPDDGKLLR